MKKNKKESLILFIKLTRENKKYIESLANKNGVNMTILMNNIISGFRKPAKYPAFKSALEDIRAV
jgi:hypothetical protein